MPNNWPIKFPPCDKNVLKILFKILLWIDIYYLQIKNNILLIKNQRVSIILNVATFIKIKKKLQMREKCHKISFSEEKDIKSKINSITI